MLENILLNLEKNKVISGREVIIVPSDKENTTLRASLFKGGASLGSDEYITGMLKVIKYQIISNAPTENLFKTLSFILERLEKDNIHNHEKLYNIYCTQLLSYYHGLNEDKKRQQKIFNKVLHKCLFAYEKSHLEFIEKESIRISSKGIRKTFEFLFDQRRDINKQNIFDMITLKYEYQKEDGSIQSNNIGTYIVGCLYSEYKGLEINIDTRERTFSSRYDFTNIETLEKYNEEYENDSKYILRNKGKFKEHSPLYYEYQIESQKAQYIIDYKEAITFINDFQKKYYYIYLYINSPDKIKGLRKSEIDNVISQALYIDLQLTISTIKDLISNLDIIDLTPLFYYLNDEVSKTLWKNNAGFLNQPHGIKWNCIIELSRMFLYKKIGLEQFNRIHNQYILSKGNSYLKIIYNLVIGKFSLSFIKVGTEFNTKGYHLLLKKIFKRFWLGEEAEQLDMFILPEEISNDIENINEEIEEIIDMVRGGESNTVEFKSTRRWHIANKKTSGDISHSVIKTIAAFLNTNGGYLFIGVEDNGNVIGLDLDIKSFKKANIDSLKLDLDEMLKNNFHENYADINIKTLILQKREICVIKINSSKEPVIINHKDNKNEEKQKFYIRRSASSVELSPQEMIAYVKSRFFTS